MNKICYIAGYIDGDGCLYIGRYIQNPKNIVVYEYSIQILSVKPSVLYEFKAQYGGSIRQKADRFRHKTPYVWTIKNKECFELARKVKNKLLDKKKSCSYFIKFIKTIKPNYGTAISEQILKTRNKLIDKIREEKHMLDLVTQEKIASLKTCESIKPCEEDFAYLAGLIDAEGCFRVKSWKPKNKPNKVYAISLEIGNTRFPIFPWLTERFGGNIVFIPTKGIKRASATWNISALALSHIINEIIPFLRIKKDTAQRILEFYNTNLPNGGDRHSEEFKKLYAEKLIERERIIEQLHILNLKGLKIK